MGKALESLSLKTQPVCNGIADCISSRSSGGSICDTFKYFLNFSVLTSDFVKGVMYFKHFLQIFSSVNNTLKQR